jgi:hypothetical protein
MRLVSSDLKDTLSQIHQSQNAIDASAKIERNIHRFIDVTESLQNSIERFDSSLENSLNITFHKIDEELGNVIAKLGDFAITISEQNRLLQDVISRYHNSRYGE